VAVSQAEERPVGEKAADEKNNQKRRAPVRLSLSSENRRAEKMLFGMNLGSGCFLELAYMCEVNVDCLVTRSMK
jgi:hypothetical protein